MDKNRKGRSGDARPTPKSNRAHDYTETEHYKSDHDVDALAAWFALGARVIERKRQRKGGSK